MTDYPREELDELLGAAVGELNDFGDEGELPADLNARVFDVLKSTKAPTVLPPTNADRRPHRNESHRMIVTKLGSVLAVLALLFGAFSFWDSPGGSGTLFAQVAERFSQLRSLTCRVQFVHDARIEMADGEFGDKLTHLAPSLHRIDDTNGNVQIVDTARKTITWVNHSEKEVLTMRGDVANAMASASPARIVEFVRQHLRADRSEDNSIHRLESRTIDGVLAAGFKSTIDGGVVEAWVDPVAQLPLLIRVKFALPSQTVSEENDVVMWRVLTNFVYDQEIDPAMFSVTVPEGYKSVDVDMPAVDARVATLDDLIAMLKACAAVNDSHFPLSLRTNDDDGTPMAIMHQHTNGLEQLMAEGSESERTAAMDQVVKMGGLIGRANAFLFSVKGEQDLQYFGGAKLNDAERPLFWYSPAADQKYKVVFADLSVHTVSRDRLPEKPIVPEVVSPLQPTNSIRVNTPRFELPPHAVEYFAKLQEIRQAGRQAEVEHLKLWLMQEFIESSVPQMDTQGKTLQEVVGEIESNGPVAVDPKWIPDRSTDSDRMKFLSEFPNLKGLDVSHLYLTHKDLDIIASCRKLERLSLSGVKVLETSARRLNGDDLKRFGDLQRLQLLDLSQSNFVGGLSHLSGCRSLHTLYLSSFEHLNDRSIGQLKVLPHLQSLVLSPAYHEKPSEKCVSDDGLRSLQDLPKLKNLFVGWHGKWTMPVDKLRKLLPNVNVVPPR